MLSTPVVIIFLVNKMKQLQHPYSKDMNIIKMSDDDAIAWALAMLRRKVHDSPQLAKNMSAVFDIDDTLIRHDDSRIDNVCGLFDTVRQMGLKTPIVTARPAEFRKDTIADLAKTNLTGYSSLSLLPLKYDRSNRISEYKWRRRSDVQSSNGSVELNVGDQWTDIFGSDVVVDGVQKRCSSKGCYLIIPLTRDGHRIMHSKLAIKLPELAH